MFGEPSGRILKTRPRRIGAGAREQACANSVSSVRRWQEGAHMSIIAWLVLGLVSGFVASKLVNRSG
ncbi:MAG: GlsB/YeaQ/YmgE family stress response membrane protein, partial [Caulobacteraceae bacterium]